MHSHREGPPAPPCPAITDPSPMNHLDHPLRFTEGKQAPRGGAPSKARMRTQAFAPAPGRTMITKPEARGTPGLTVGGCHCTAVDAPATGMPCKEKGYAMQI